MDDETPGVGHNSKGEPGATLPNSDDFVRGVKREHAELRERLLDLKVGLGRLPKEITDDNSAQVTTFIAQCKRALRECEDARKAAGLPLRNLVAALNDAFALWAAPVSDSLKAAETSLSVYMVDKRRRAQEAAAKAKAEEDARAAMAEAEARILREAADAAARAATTERARREAAEAEERAAEAASKAESAAKAASEIDPSRANGNVVGEYGAASAHTRTTWEYEVLDISKVPTFLVQIDPKAVRELIADARRSGETPSAPGIRFFQNERAVVRSN